MELQILKLKFLLKSKWEQSEFSQLKQSKYFIEYNPLYKDTHRKNRTVTRTVGIHKDQTKSGACVLKRRPNIRLEFETFKTELKLCLHKTIQLFRFKWNNIIPNHTYIFHD